MDPGGRYLSLIFDLFAVITLGRTIFDVDDDFPVILLGINLGPSSMSVPEYQQCLISDNPI